MALPTDMSDVAEQPETTPAETSDSAEPPDTGAATDTAEAAGSDTAEAPDGMPEVQDTTAGETAIEAAPGVLTYTRVDNISIVDDLTHIAWSKSGRYALVAGRAGKLGFYAPGEPLQLLGTVGSDIADLLALGDEQFAVLDTALGVLRIAVDPLGPSLELVATTPLPIGSGRALSAEPGSDRVAIGAHGTDSIAYLYLWTPAGISPVKGFNAGAGISDLMWASPALYAGSPSIVTAHGHNGADSKSWILATDLVIANTWSPGFGNAGRSEWRPGGDYGIVCGWSSNKLYVFDGSWTSATLPVPNGASPNAVAWKSDGGRALIVGRVIGTPAYAVVIEQRPTTDFWLANFVDQSIRDFGAAPWNGNTASMHLLDVAWRPGTSCDEGLIVGTDNGTSFAPTMGLAVHFSDANDPACQDKN